MSTIEWTDDTWNPVVGCTRVSEGCRHCYAERQATRLAEDLGVDSYAGIARRTKAGPRWTGAVKLLPERLDQPLRWRKPRRIFVNSMSDLFHEELSDEEIAAVFGVMAAAPAHTFQVLTKRPERAVCWYQWAEDQHPLAEWFCMMKARDLIGDWSVAEQIDESIPLGWPLPNVWLGVSAEDQETADKRIPDLLTCPAAVRFVSYEPALGPVDFPPYLGARTYRCRCGFHRTEEELIFTGGDRHLCADCGERCEVLPSLDWIIAGGESGPGARQCDLNWFRDVRSQCRATGTAFFMKQVGAQLAAGLGSLSRKGGSMAAWPEDLRIRMFPGDEIDHA